MRQRRLTVGITASLGMDGRWWEEKSRMLQEAGMQSVWWTRLCYLRNHRPKPASELTGWLKLYTTAFENHLNGDVFGMLSCRVRRRVAFLHFCANTCKYNSVRACIYIVHNVRTYLAKNITSGENMYTCTHAQTHGRIQMYLLTGKYTTAHVGLHAHIHRCFRSHVHMHSHT